MVQVGDTGKSGRFAALEQSEQKKTRKNGVMKEEQRCEIEIYRKGTGKVKNGAESGQ